MIKSEILKSALLLLALITVIVIALAEPIAGHMMGQGNIMGQQSMIIVCSDNQTCTVIQSSMGDHSSNETMIHCMPGNDSMMGNLSANETMMQCMLGNDSMMNGSCCIIEMDQSAIAAQARLDCAQFWLEQAIEMHEMHLKDPSTATNESQLEMMNQMMWAYECIVGENMTKNMTQNMTLEMMNTTADPELRGYYRTYAIELRNY